MRNTRGIEALSFPTRGREQVLVFRWGKTLMDLLQYNSLPDIVQTPYDTEGCECWYQEKKNLNSFSS